MTVARTLLFTYTAALSLIVALGSAAQIRDNGNPFILLLFLPVVAHFILTMLKPKMGHKLLLYYNFVITSIMAASGFIGSTTLHETISAVLFTPLALYFWLLVLPKRGKKLEIEEPKDMPNKDFDIDRRTFIKLVGSVSLGVFFLSIFNRKIDDTFFGRLTNPAGKSIIENKAATSQPGEAGKLPTDIYKITEIDDSTPTYFGFVDKTGKWYIMQESEDGSFRYTKGDANFTSNWPNRASLPYALYDSVF